MKKDSIDNIKPYRFADLLPAKPEQKKEETWIKKRW